MTLTLEQLNTAAAPQAAQCNDSDYVCAAMIGRNMKVID